MLLQQIQHAIAAYKIGASLQEMQALKDSLKWELASLPLAGSPATNFSESESVDFAAGAKKTKKCTKGYNCGGSCISKTKNCLKKLPGQFHTYAEWATAQANQGGTGSEDKGVVGGLDRKGELPTEVDPRQKSWKQKSWDTDAAAMDLYKTKYASKHLNFLTLGGKEGAIAMGEQMMKPGWEKPPPPPTPIGLGTVVMYTGLAFEDINATLRSRSPQDVDPEMALFVEKATKAINSCLAELPDHEGTVFRGADLPDEVLAKYRDNVGGVITEEAFVSSSEREGIASKAFEGNTYYTIRSKHGKKLERYSLFPEEAEVLFASGTKFKVNNYQEKDGKVTIELEEI